MSKRNWIIAIVAGGVGLAILIGVLGTQATDESQPTQTEASQSLCTSLDALSTDVNSLTSLDPSTASKDEYQSDVSAIQADWNEVQSNAQELHSVNQSSLDSAWNAFKASVDNVSGTDTVSDAVTSVSTSAQALATTAQATAQSLSC